jgi:hypothetical protein
MTSQQPSAELAQYGVVEARITQFQPEQIFPITASSHRIGRLTIGQTFSELEHGDHSQSPRRLRRLPSRWEQGAEAGILVNAAKLITQLDAHVPGRKGSTRHAGGLFGHRPN